MVRSKLNDRSTVRLRAAKASTTTATVAGTSAASLASSPFMRWPSDVPTSEPALVAHCPQANIDSACSGLRRPTAASV